MKNDEFNTRTSEYSNIPKEINVHEKEYNEDYALKRNIGRAEKKKEIEEEKNKTLRKKLISYVTGAAVGVSMVTTAGGGIFGLGRAAGLTDDYKYIFDSYNSAYFETMDDRQLGVLVSGALQTNGAFWSKEVFSLEDGISLTFDYMTAGGGENDLLAWSGDGLAVNVASPENINIQNAKNGGELGYIGDWGIEIDYFENPLYEIREQKDYRAEHISVIDKNMKHLDGTENLKLQGHNWYHVRVDIASVNKNEASVKAYINEDLFAQSIVQTDSNDIKLGISAGNGDGYGWVFISDVRINDGRVRLCGKENEDVIYINKLTELGILPPDMGGMLSNYGKKDELVKIPYDSYSEPELPHGEQITDSDKNEINEEYAPQYTEENDDHDENDNHDDNDGTEIMCDECNGYGIICNGSVEADDPEGCHGVGIVQCKACNRTGKESDGSPCDWCKGTLSHICPSFEFHITCEKCGGTGYIRQ